MKNKAINGQCVGYKSIKDMKPRRGYGWGSGAVALSNDCFAREYFESPMEDIPEIQRIEKEILSDLELISISSEDSFSNLFGETKWFYDKNNNFSINLKKGYLIIPEVGKFGFKAIKKNSLDNKYKLGYGSLNIYPKEDAEKILTYNEELKNARREIVGGYLGMIVGGIITTSISMNFDGGISLALSGMVPGTFFGVKSCINQSRKINQKDRIKPLYSGKEAIKKLK